MKQRQGLRSILDEDGVCAVNGTSENLLSLKDGGDLTSAEKVRHQKWFVGLCSRRSRIIGFLGLVFLTMINLFGFFPNKQKALFQEHSKLRSTISVDEKPLPPFFAACLIVMDDNHRLPEWLAYHYHMLPLRYLVVMVDQRSQTTPSAIFQLWREHSDMTIVQWNGTERFWRRTVSVDPSQENDPNQLRTSHILRQEAFYQACMIHLQEEFLNKQEELWTAFWDTDEFVSLNYNVISDSAQLAQQPGSISQFLKTHPVHNFNASEESAKNNTPPYLQSLHRPCTTFPRVTIAAVEMQDDFDSVSNSHIHTQSAMFPNWIEAKHFETLQWRYYDHESRNLATSVNGKSIVDVLHSKSVAFIQSGAVPNIHRMLYAKGYLVPTRRDSALLLHHYMGSWEFYSARKFDCRRGTLEHSRVVWEMLSRFPDAAMDAAVQQSWVRGFVDHVGEATARLLLKAAGMIEIVQTETMVDWNVTVKSGVDKQYSSQILDRRD